MLSTALVAYLVLFILVGVLFLFVSLLIGWFIRPRAPSVTKGEPYECGEPAVGSGFVQFDLRFYVVALLFIIFEVELAFFFPPAVVFGKVNQLLDPHFGPKVAVSESAPPQTDPRSEFTPATQKKFQELGIAVPPESSSSKSGSQGTATATSPDSETKGSSTDHAWKMLPPAEKAQVLDVRLDSLALMILLDLGVFFIVLLVGFAYLWKQGDLNWVRAVARRPASGGLKLAPQPQGEGR